MAVNQVYLIKSGDGLFLEEDEAIFGISDGYIGVGTNSPNHNFEVVGSTNLGSLTINSNNITLGLGGSSDDYINGGGFILKGDDDKTIVWSQARGAWISNQNLVLSSSKYIATDSIRALDSDGLTLYEQNGSKGILVKNGGDVNISDDLEVVGELRLSQDLVLQGALNTSGIKAIDDNGIKFEDNDGNSAFVINDGAGINFNATVIFDNTVDVNNTLSANTHIETDKLRARSEAGLTLQDDGGNGITISDGGDVEASQNFTIQGALDVNNTLSANTHIETDKLRARSEAGLTLQDDGGNGITISDGGNVEASQNFTIQGTLDVNNTLSANTHIETDKLRARSEAGLTLQDDGGNGITISDGGDVSLTHKLKIDGSSEFNNSISYSGSNFVNVIRPQGSFYKSGSATGVIKITLPQSWTSNLMSFDLSVTQGDGFVDSNSFTLKVCGKNNDSNNSWEHVSAQVISSTTNKDFNVRFGHDGSKCAIYVGELNSSWVEPIINLYNFVASYNESSSSHEDWSKDWNISIVNEFGTISQTATAHLIATSLDLRNSDLLTNHYFILASQATNETKPYTSNKLFWDSSDATLSVTGGVKVGNLLTIDRDGYVPWDKVKNAPFKGYTLEDIIPWVSSENFTDGTLVTTDIPANETDGASYIIEVTGKSYSSTQPPFLWVAQGHISQGTIRNHSAISSSGYAPDYMKVLKYTDNNLAFWWPKVSDSNSFAVQVRYAGNEWNNRVTGIINSVLPTTDKIVQTDIKKSWTEYNDGHNSGLDADTLDTLHASSFVRNDDTSDQTIPSKLTISKQLHLTQTSTTIGGKNLSNASLLIGSSGQGIGIDDNEIYASGDNLYIGVIDADDIVFRTNNGSESQSTTKAVLNSSGKFVIGRSSAVAEFSVYSGTQGFEVRPNNGSAGNGTLVEYLSRDADSSQTSYNNHRSIATEHKFDVNDGTSLSTALYCDSSGNVGIGTTSLNNTLTLRKSSEGQVAHGLRIEFEDNTEGSVVQTTSEINAGPNGLVFSNLNNSRNFIFSGGRIGVGVTNPQHTLQILGDLGVGGNSGDAGISDGIIFNSTSTSNYRNFIQHTDEGLIFSNTSASNANRDYVFEDGRVGVGLINPSEELEVLGNVRLTNWLKASGDLILVADDNADNSASSIRFMVDGIITETNEKMRLSNLGYLGIGTIDPKNKLHVDYSVNASIANLSEVNDYSSIRFGPFRADNDTNLYVGGAAGARPMLQARDSSAAGSAKDLLLNPFGGYVGVGTVTPSYTLDVDGSTRITGDLIVDGIVSVADSTSRISVYHNDSGYATHKYYLLLIEYDSNTYAAGKIVGFRQGDSNAFRMLDTYINVASTAYPETPTDTQGTMSAFRDRTWTTGGDAFGEFAKVSFGGKYYLALEVDQGTNIHDMSWDFEGRTNANSDPNFFTLKRDDQITYDSSHLNYKRLDSNLFSNQSGFLGVKNSNPQSILDVKADGSNNIYRATDTNNYYRWRIDQSYNMYFSDANQADKSIFKNDGRVGLGTTTPWTPLTITKTYGDYGSDGANDDIAIALDQSQANKGIGLRFKTGSVYYQNLIDSSGTLHWKSYTSGNYRSRLLLTQAGALSLGSPGNGENAFGRFLSFEGNTDSSGEASSRIFFTEHNRTTGSQDAYGMSLAYRGGGTSITSAAGGNWTGLTQIGNGEWAMFGHNASDTGTVIMKGDRAGTYIHQNADVIIEGDVSAASLKTSSWTIDEDSNGDLIFSYS